MMVASVTAMAQDSAAKLSDYKKGHRTFTTTTGHTYPAEGIQRVTDAFVTVITDDGVTRVKTGDMPADFRKLFGFSDTKLKEAEKEYARKRYDSKKSAIRKKKAERSVSARKFRLTLTVVEEVEFGAICDAQYLEEVVKTVTKRVQAKGLDRDQDTRIKRVAVKTEEAQGLPEKMMVRGLPGTLKVGSSWEGDAYMVGTYVYEEKSKIPGRSGGLITDIPMAFVKYKEAVAFRAATPEDGSEGDGSGTGVVISENGYILTSYRLVMDADTINVTIPDSDRPVRAKVVAKDPKENLAVLKVSKKLKPAPISMAPRVTLGQSVFTMGFPDTDMRSRQLKFTEGTVAALKGVQEDIRFFQVEGDFQAGNFGGGLFDEKGIVIGVVTPNPPESFFLDESGSEFEPLQYVTKGTRFKNLLKKLSGFKAETVAPADPKAAAIAATVLVTVKRSKR